MYHPTTRLLTILELLQTHPFLTGAELARRLEVAPRTVRRYIQMLQEMGIPIEGTRGVAGGYELRAGFKLPPLLFTQDEAVAILLGLVALPRLNVQHPATAVEGAIAKIYRVVPEEVRQRLTAFTTHLALDRNLRGPLPNIARVAAFADAAQQQRQVAIDYRSRKEAITQRTIAPYGVVGWEGNWFVVGYCSLRAAVRSFRIDRVLSMQLLTTTFIVPEAFDSLAFVIAGMADLPGRWQIEVEFKANLDLVSRKIPANYGRLTETSTGTLFQCNYDDLADMGRYLIGSGFPLEIRKPSALKDVLRQLAYEILQLTDH